MLDHRPCIRVADIDSPDASAPIINPPPTRLQSVALTRTPMWCLSMIYPDLLSPSLVAGNEAVKRIINYSNLLCHSTRAL
jgi:hypothetical protein